MVTSRNIKLLTTTKLSVKNTPKLDKFWMMAGAVPICVRIPAWICHLDWNLIIELPAMVTGRNIKLLTTTKLSVKNTPNLTNSG
jgi:hypothetical protein